MSNMLVAYFSATGTTAKVAKALAQAAGADLYEIRPAVPYSRADLNWTDKSSRSSVEMREQSSRPALADHDAPVAGHDTILLGYPLWWGDAPLIVRTFLESGDFGGKTIIPFCTSSSSGFGDSGKHLEAFAPGAAWQDGMRFSSNTDVQDVADWANSLF